MRGLNFVKVNLTNLLEESVLLFSLQGLAEFNVSLVKKNSSICRI